MIRKKRIDRNHVIYQVTCPDTGDFYIGLTVARGQAFLKSVKIRLQNHFSAARTKDKDQIFAHFIRNNPEAQYLYEVVEVVRGRKAAHQRERELISLYEPSLNTK